MSVITLAAIFLKLQIINYKVINTLFLEFDSWIWPKCFVQEIWHDLLPMVISTQLSLDKRHTAVLDATRNNSVYESLAITDDYLQ